MITVQHGDCLKIIPTLGLTVDAVVTDPPYHLLPTVKRFSASNSAPVKVPEFFASDGKSKGSSPYLRGSSGFMGQQWDGGDIAFRPETWATIGSVLRPGGFLVAFGGTRTYHRLACAIEDGGFVIQDCLMWLFATGFPKRGDMLKPAYEPIVLAYKPGGKRTMQIEECRIPASGRPLRSHAPRPTDDGASSYDMGSGFHLGKTDLGRWPANVCHDGSDEVVAAFPGTGPSSAGMRGEQHSGRHGGLAVSGPNIKSGTNSLRGHDDNGGSAARFFFSAKAGAQDRWGSRHPTVKPVELMKWLVGLVTPPGGVVLDPFAGSGTTAVAALATGRDAILIEREAQYVADIRERLAFYEGDGRHSIASKARRSQPRSDAPLFAEDPWCFT
jgi:site-specific DNA-methyltransferase (adenine-specific)